MSVSLKADIQYKGISTDTCRASRRSCPAGGCAASCGKWDAISPRVIE